MMKAVKHFLLPVAAFILLTLSSCGKDTSPFPDAPTSAPIASAGKGVLSGTVNTGDNRCLAAGYVVITVQSAGVGTVVFQDSVVPNGAYEAQLDAGSYVLTVHAPPCIYADSFNITTGQSLIISPILL